MTDRPDGRRTLLPIGGIQCYDCGTWFDTRERECPRCALRTCISEGAWWPEAAGDDALLTKPPQ
jgi:hypothetical protein